MSYYTPMVAKLLRDAAAAGLTVEHSGPHRLDIFEPKRGGVGVRIYLTETGGFHEAHRTDVDLSLALGIRTIKAVRKIMRLEAT
jgi:hypothetical protein